MNKENFTYFWSNTSPFSNWYKVDFKVGHTAFSSSEQCMMYQKALLFGDEETAEKILQTRNPGKQKALGRSVKGFDQSLWEAKREQIVYDANYYKFTQNPDILTSLLETKGTMIVEASPVDTIWGIGLAEDDPLAQDRKTWKGLNLLGKVLTELRDNLIKDGNQ